MENFLSDFISCSHPSYSMNYKYDNLLDEPYGDLERLAWRISCHISSPVGALHMS